jgi:predicted Zn-dependent protease
MTYWMKEVLIALLILIVSFSQGRSGEIQNSGKAAMEAIKEVAPMGLPDAWNLHIRGRKTKSAAAEAEAALRQAEKAKAKARSLGDNESERIADQAVAIAQAALEQAKKDLTRLAGISLILTRLRQAYAKSLGDEVDAAFEEKYGFLSNPALEKRLTELLGRVKKVSFRPEENLPIKILDTQAGGPSAFSSPSAIYVGNGFLNLSRSRPSENELLYILAHEVSHAELDHGILGVAKWNELDIRDVFKEEWLSARDNRADDAIRRAARAAVWGIYTREQEFQADLAGAHFAISAGASPRGIKECFDRISKDHDKFVKSLTPADQKLQELIATHPSPSERLKALEKDLGERFWDKATP